MYQAIYFDGLTATANEALIEVKNKKLSIRPQTKNEGDDKLAVIQWPLSSIRLVPSTHTEQPLRLSCKNFGEARLAIADAQTITYLKQHLPTELFKKQGIFQLIKLSAALMIASLSFLALVYYTVPLLSRPVAALIPLRFEKQLGQGVYADLTAQWPPCLANDQSNQIINKLSRTLWPEGEYSTGPKVIVVKSHIENAFTLPGGMILITSALLDSLNTPDELAGILAHEEGHVHFRHSMVTLVQRVGIGFAVSLISGGSSSDLIVTAGRQLTELSYSRNLEREADEFALKALKSANISPTGYADFFERMAEKEAKSNTGSLNTIISTHPHSEGRATAARNAKINNPKPALSQAEWALVQSVCESID